MGTDLSTAARPGAARGPADAAAILTIVLVALAALAASWRLPWWTMEARAPQYGQRVLLVHVNPGSVSGDVFEIDTLGHYVGIQPISSLAPVERKLAPLGLLAAALGILALPWLQRRWLRLLAAAPAVVLPLLFLADLKYWMDRSTIERDLEAALNLTVNSIEPRILGRYSVGQFQVRAKAETGLYLATTGGLLALGLALSRPLARLAAGRRNLAAAAALLAAAGAHPALGAELAVRPGESVGAAVARAGAGDTVRLLAGVHRERVVLDRAVALEGEPGAVLDGGGEGTVVTIRASGVELRDLVVRGSGSSYTSEDAGVRIDGATDVRLTRTRIEDVLFGVFVLRGDRLRIEDSSIEGKDLPPERRGDGIRLWYSSDCILRGNHVVRTRDVIIWYSSGTRVEDNVVRWGRYGLHYMYSDRNSFRGNLFDENQVGATIMYSRGIRLDGNSFSYSRGIGGYGLLVKESDDVDIQHNRFVGNQTALFFDDSPQARDGFAEVRGNLIADNDTGVAIQPLTRRARFHGNAFVANRTQVSVLGAGNADGCQWSAGGRGNYWSDAVPYDRDGDGVSEIPYRLESTYEVLADRIPVLAFFAGTPGAEAIDLAARWFPVFAPRPRLTDPHPLVQPQLEGSMAAPPPAGGSGIAAAGLALLGLAGLPGLIARRAFR